MTSSISFRSSSLERRRRPRRRCPRCASGRRAPTIAACTPGAPGSRPRPAGPPCARAPRRSPSAAPPPRGCARSASPANRSVPLRQSSSGSLSPGEKRAAQQPVRQRPVDQHAHVVLGGTRAGLVALEVATEQVERRLGGLHATSAVQLGHLLGGRSSTRRRGGSCPRGPGRQDARGLGERGVRVGPVHLVEVDVVHAEVARLSSTPWRSHSGEESRSEVVAGRAQPALGGDHHARRGASLELVAEGRRGGAARPGPKPYPCAVSKKLMSASRALRMAASASSRSTSPQSPPNCQVPKQMRETRRSVLPSRVCCMAGGLPRSGVRDTDPAPCHHGAGCGSRSVQRRWLGALVAPRRRSAASSPDLWATINHCDVARLGGHPRQHAGQRHLPAHVHALLGPVPQRRRPLRRDRLQHALDQGRHGPHPLGPVGLRLRVRAARPRAPRSRSAARSTTAGRPSRGKRWRVVRTAKRVTRAGVKGVEGSVPAGRLGGHLRDRPLGGSRPAGGGARCAPPARPAAPARRPGWPRPRARTSSSTESDSEPRASSSALPRPSPPAPAAPPSSSPEVSVTEMAA